MKSNPKTSQWIHTYGKKPCEISLAKCLAEVQDIKITTYVGNSITDFRKGTKELSAIPLASREKFLKLWHEKFVNKITSKKLPKQVETHLLCCLFAYARESLEIKPLKVLQRESGINGAIES